MTIKDTWDVMGMRATRSDDTVLESAFVPDKYIVRSVPAGLAGADYFVLSIFAWALGGFGMFKKSEMERLFRDARAGRFHPANSSLAHELVGKLALGINPDDPQRWG